MPISLASQKLHDINGKWVPNPYLIGLEFYLTYDGGYQQVRQRILKGHADKLKVLEAASTAKENAPQKQKDAAKDAMVEYAKIVDEAGLEAFCSTRFLDFRMEEDDLVGDDGKPLENTLQVRMKIMTDCPHWMTWADNFSISPENWQVSDADKEDIKK